MATMNPKQQARQAAMQDKLAMQNQKSKRPVNAGPAPEMPTVNFPTPKIDEAIAKSLAKNTSVYDQLTNINRGKPNIAPSPTATPMVPTKPNLRDLTNGLKEPRNLGPDGQKKMLPERTGKLYNPGNYIPEDIMTPEARNPFQPQMDKDMIDKILANLPRGVDPNAVQANPQGYLQEMENRRQQDAMGNFLRALPPGANMSAVETNPQGYMREMQQMQKQQMLPPQMDINKLKQLYQQLMPQQPTNAGGYIPQPPLPYQQQMQQQALQSAVGQPQMPMQYAGPQMPMQTPQPAGLGSLTTQKFNPSFGGSMGQPAQNIQPAFGGNMLGQKNAFS